MELCLITNNDALARESEAAGIDRILVDLERLGKAKRQAGQGLFLSQHQPEDVAHLSAILYRARMMVRINPVHSKTRQEIEKCLRDGAQVIMLPMFRDAVEVAEFVRLIRGRAETSLLLETKEAVGRIGSIVRVGGVDEIHIGLNDLRLSLGLDVIFEPLCSGLLDFLSKTIRSAGIRFGFGGIARLRQSDLPISPRRVIAEQVRLGASVALLGRSFRQEFEQPHAPGELAREVRLIRATIEQWRQATPVQRDRNRRILAGEVEKWRTQTIANRRRSRER